MNRVVRNCLELGSGSGNLQNWYGTPPKLMPHNPYSKAAKPIGDPPIFGDGIFPKQTISSLAHATRPGRRLSSGAKQMVWLSSLVLQHPQRSRLGDRHGLAQNLQVRSLFKCLFIIWHLKSHFDFCQFDLRSLFYLIKELIHQSDPLIFKHHW